MPRHGAVLRLCRTAGDHDLLADVRPRLGLCSSPWHAQRPPGTKAAHQLAFESASALNVQRLVNGFVRDSHRFIVREVDLQPAGNLLWRPASDPFAVAAMRRVPPLKRCRSRASNLTSSRVTDLAFQAVFHIVAQLLVNHKLCRLRPSGHHLCLPLRDRSPILELATTSCRVACQLA